MSLIIGGTVSLRVGLTALRFYSAARWVTCIYTCIFHEDSVMMHSVASSHTPKSRDLHNTPEASDAAQDRAPVSPAASLGPTILIVEDEPAFTRALERLLIRDGYQVEVT